MFHKVEFKVSKSIENSREILLNKSGKVIDWEDNSKVGFGDVIITEWIWINTSLILRKSSVLQQSQIPKHRVT